MIKALARILFYPIFWIRLIIGLLLDMIFHTSGYYSINTNARRKLMNYCKAIIREKGLKISQIAYEAQISPFILYAILGGLITTPRLRTISIFLEKYKDGEELLGSCFLLNILPIPSTILVDNRPVLMNAKNIDCGFTYGYFIPSPFHCFLSYMVSPYFQQHQEALRRLLRSIETYKDVLKGNFAYGLTKNVLNPIKENIALKRMVSEVEKDLFPTLPLNFRDLFIYKMRVKSYKVDKAGDQNQLMNNIVNFANDIRNEMGIDSGKEGSFTRFFSHEKIIDCAKGHSSDINMHAIDPGVNICRKIQLDALLDSEIGGEMGRNLGGISVSSKHKGEVVVILNSRFHPYRMVFWFLHEISHYLLNHPGSYSTNWWEFYKLRKNPEITRFETEACLLTAELILPSEKLLAFIDNYEFSNTEQEQGYIELSELFDVDPYQMGTRLLQLNKKHLVDEKGTYAQYRESYYKYYS